MKDISMYKTIKSYARTKGNITSGQKKAILLGEKHLVSYQPSLLNYQHVFNNNKAVTMEIGFGMGYATACIAQQNPDKNYLAVDVYEAGVGKLLMEIKNRSLNNLKIIQHDATDVVLNQIEANSLTAFHIFFPDPWPKAKHHKRRLLQPAFIHTLASRLQVGGYLYFVTDWQNYAEETLNFLQAEPLLANQYALYADKQEWRPKTKFEEKGTQRQHSIYELMFKRL